MILFSPAKINLFFRVLRKRSDGYHEIASLFQAINLFDTLHFTPNDHDLLTCSDPELTCGLDNLVMKALSLFRTRYPLFPIKIHLDKRIPCQAGLGGGSGNAATTLFALNELAGRPATLPQLTSLAALIGSDVSFFLSTGTAYCTGRGEILEPYSLPHPFEGWLAKPPFGLSTPLVYKETRVEELAPRDPREALSLFRARYPLFFNDLEPAALRLEPRLLEFRKKLDQTFPSVTMSGSGTSFFCMGAKPMGSDLTPFRSIQRDVNSWYTPS